MANNTWAQGIDHGWIARTRSTTTAVESIPRRRRFVLSDWLASARQARGESVTRETQRAYGDLQAARDARESGR
ncbi:hypothetical protein ACFVWR_00760 [Leifsonia sp. NPDC058292]|uniref:hypothetical protein n=1 Tax=Leifsonia sp. NPDC058292 TaxID=3346428 RepID=UPI0036D77D6A